MKVVKYNKYNLTGEYGIGYTEKGEEFYFDSEDYDLIKDYYWAINNGGYLTSTKNNKTLYFTKLVKNSKKTMRYLNRNKLDNRKKNLTDGYYKRKYQDYKIIDNCGIIYVENNEVLIDIDDLDKVIQFLWRIDEDGYVVNRQGKKIIYLHRLITKCNKNEEADHKNRNKLDNRKNNLRICTRAQNQQNQSKRTNRKYTSKHKGVNWSKDVWRCRISCENIRMLIGFFNNEDAAGNAYNYYAKIIHKEFACFNQVKFMEKDEWEKYIVPTVIKNKNGLRGVTYRHQNNKWRSRIGFNHKEILIGYFETKEEASEAYLREYKKFKDMETREIIKNGRTTEIHIDDYISIMGLETTHTL